LNATFTSKDVTITSKEHNVFACEQCMHNYGQV